MYRNGRWRTGKCLFLDEDNVKIYIWNQKYQVYARFGTEGIAELKERIVNSKKMIFRMKARSITRECRLRRKIFDWILIFWNIWIFKGHWKKII